MAAKKGWKGVNYEDESSSEKVEKAFNIAPTVGHLDGGYDFQFQKQVHTTDQGWLLIAELKPKVTSLPSFQIRWDQKGDHLNADIQRVSKKEESWFHGGKHGYSGHKGVKVPGIDRASAFDIWIPGRQVFKGHFDFNLVHDMAMGANLELTATATVEVVKI